MVLPRRTLSIGYTVYEHQRLPLSSLAQLPHPNLKVSREKVFIHRLPGISNSPDCCLFLSVHLLHLALGRIIGMRPSGGAEPVLEHFTLTLVCENC